MEKSFDVKKELSIRSKMLKWSTVIALLVAGLAYWVVCHYIHDITHMTGDEKVTYLVTVLLVAISSFYNMHHLHRYYDLQNTIED